MIKRDYLYILDVCAVLLFSILANYIFDLKINFHKSVDLVKLFKLISLLTSTLTFYITIDRLKKMSDFSELEYAHERNEEKRANAKIDNIYKGLYKEKKRKINLGLFISLIFTILFFLIEPILKY